MEEKHRSSTFRNMVVCLAMISLLAGAVAFGQSAEKPDVVGTSYGKFYIVGMGTAPDLITVRALDAVKSADVIIVHDPQGLEDWKDLIGQKEAWIFERYNLVYYGTDLSTLENADEKQLAEEHQAACCNIISKVRAALEQGQTVAVLEGGDPMMYGVTFYLEKLPKDVSSEIIPGVGAFQAASAALKMTPVYGWDTNAVILTMADWPGRVDTNEKLMGTESSMVFYTMHLDYTQLFAELKRHYPQDTPVAIVCYAGDRQRQQVLTSTVGRFLDEVKLIDVPIDAHMLFVGKFLTAGQARKDGLRGGMRFIDRMRYENRQSEEEN